MKPDGAIRTLLKLCTATAIAAAAITTNFAQAADAKKPAAAADKKPAAPPEPVTEVKKEDFRVSVSLPAVFEGTRLTPISVSPEVWSDLTITHLIPHGARVTKGARLVQLDLKNLEEQIEALEQAEKTARLTLQTSIDGLANYEKRHPLELQAARRAKQQGDENLERWIKNERAREEETYRRNTEAAERQLEYAKEELNQLQKMYDEDDLTEETEEIILKRAKISVEIGEFYLKRSIESRDYALKVTIPRKHQANIDANKLANLNYELAWRTIPRTLALKRLEVEKAKDDARKATRKFYDLKRDLATLSKITAPVDGTVYYGESQSGTWTSAAEAKKLVVGGKLAPKAKFMTIVADGALRVQTTIPEDKLAILRPGARGHVTPTADPLQRIPARLGPINYALSPLGLKTSASIELPENSRLMPGMNGKLHFTIADRKGVLTVPVTAVTREGNKTFVHLVKEGAEAEKRQVRVAETDGKKIAVLQGLAEKDRVLTVAP